MRGKKLLILTLAAVAVVCAVVLFLPPNKRIIEKKNLPQPLVLNTQTNYDKNTFGRLVWADYSFPYKEFLRLTFKDPEECKSVGKEYEAIIGKALQRAGVSTNKFFSIAEQSLRTKEILRDRHLFIPIYLDQANFNGKEVWIIIYCWEDKEPPGVATGDLRVMLSHSAGVVISKADLRPIYTTRCK